MRNFDSIPKKDLLLVSESMIGILLLNCQIDSNGDPVDAENYYKMYKHVPSGKLIIFPNGNNMRNEKLNLKLKVTGELN